MTTERGGEIPKEAREEIELKELSELSGLSPEEIKRFREMQDKYGFGKPVESFWAKERPLEKTPEEKAFEKLTKEEKEKILPEYAKSRNQIRDRANEMKRELAGYTGPFEQVFGHRSGEEQKRAEAKQKEWNALPREEQQKRWEPILKLERLLRPGTKEKK